MWDADFGRKGDFLGEAHLSKQDLADAVPVDGEHEFTVTLGPKPTGTDSFNRTSQGSLRLTCQVGRDVRFNISCSTVLDRLVGCASLYGC